MGEIADMILDGQMCQGCGEYLGEGCGFPEYCTGCQEEADKSKPKPSEETEEKAEES